MSSIAFNNNLEDNPFADPFSRPRSPDPWTSYTAQREPQRESTLHEDEEPENQASSNASPRAIFSPSPAQFPGTPAEPSISPLPDTSTDPLESTIARTPSPSPKRQFRQLPVLQASADGPDARSQPTPKVENVSSPQQTPVVTQPPSLPFNSLPTPIPNEPGPKDVRISILSETPVKPSQQPLPPSAPPTPAPVPSISARPVATASSLASQQLPVAERIQTPLDAPGPATSSYGNYKQVQHFTSLSLGGEAPGTGWRVAEPNFSDEETTNNNTAAPSREVADANGAPHNQLLPGPTEILSSPAFGAPIPVFVIKVEDPQKVGDAIRGYTMYTVQTQITHPHQPQSACTVLRRYSDFLWLYDTLSFNNPGVIVPPVPEKNPFGRFQDTFVEQRRLGLQQCIQKIADHPILCKDSDLRFFLESDNFVLDVKHRRTEGANGSEKPSGGLMASIGSSLTGAKFFEIDEWFDQKKLYFDALEGQLKGLGKAIDVVTKSRQEMSASLHEFSETLAELSIADLSKTMVISLATLAEVERKAKEMQDAQARDDTVTLLNTVDEYTRLINSVRLAFASRVRLHAAWNAADNDLRRVKTNQDKARRQGKLPADRTAYSVAEIQEAERRAQEAKREFDKVSRLIKIEVARFEKERIEDFKNSLETLLNGMIDRQRDVIRAWEHYQELLLRRANAQMQAGAQQPRPPPSTEAKPPEEAQGNVVES